MTRALVLVHRWLGVSFCLLFAMWFATGIVMHFVPFPSLTEAERIEGLATVDPVGVERGPSQAVNESRMGHTARVRLQQRVDGPVYLVRDASNVVALYAADFSNAAVQSPALALTIAVDHARRRGLGTSEAKSAELAPYDQWTVPNGFDIHRPLYRIALNDDVGTEIYVSSTTGEVVLDTTRRERGWNYVGSVAHWIYPTALRSNWAAWDWTVWTLSLVALIGTISGVLLGTLRLKVARGRLLSPYRGWHAWHHVLGLFCMTFVLTWIFSGWLSMDHGRLFSTGKPSPAEALAVAGAAPWQTMAMQEFKGSFGQAKEVEWFAFNGRIYRRDRLGFDSQRLSQAGGSNDVLAVDRKFLDRNDVDAVGLRLAGGCERAVAVEARDDYAPVAALPSAPVYRLVCGDVWFHVDAASGAILERLDGSRRAYRWLYTALHTLDIPALAERPMLRTVLVVTLCAVGLGFSLTGVMIGWRRLKRWVWHAAPAW